MCFIKRELIMNMQEIFDTVVTHLYTQKKRAYDMEFGCAYRTKDGLKCAAGVLIPDELYSSDMERKPFSILVSKFESLQTIFDIKDTKILGMIQHLQDAHDMRYHWSKDGPNEDMKKCLKTLVDIFHLDDKVLNEMTKKEIE